MKFTKNEHYCSVDNVHTARRWFNKLKQFGFESTVTVEFRAGEEPNYLLAIGCSSREYEMIRTYILEG